MRRPRRDGGHGINFGTSLNWTTAGPPQFWPRGPEFTATLTARSRFPPPGPEALTVPFLIERTQTCGRRGPRARTGCVTTLVHPSCTGKRIPQRASPVAVDKHQASSTTVTRYRVRSAEMATPSELVQRFIDPLHDVEAIEHVHRLRQMLRQNGLIAEVAD